MPISRPPSLQPSSAPAQRQQNGSGSGSGSGSLPRAAFSVVAGPKTNSPPPGLKITDTQQLELVRLDQQRHSLSFFTSPFRVLQYAVMFLGSQAVRVVLYVVSNRQLLLGIAIPSAIMFALHAIDHPLSGALGRFDALMLWYGYWLALGIASSIGLGAGLHTFVLFLGPHIAEATLSAYQCGDLNFSVRGPDAFQCRTNGNGNGNGEGMDGFVGLISSVLMYIGHLIGLGSPVSSVAASAAAGVAKVSIWRIYRKISAEALLWGAGTAIGELPPYFMARAAALSGRRNPELDAIAALTTSQSPEKHANSIFASSSSSNNAAGWPRRQRSASVGERRYGSGSKSDSEHRPSDNVFASNDLMARPPPAASTASAGGLLPPIALGRSKSTVSRRRTMPNPSTQSSDEQQQNQQQQQQQQLLDEYAEADLPSHASSTSNFQVGDGDISDDNLSVTSSSSEQTTSMMNDPAVLKKRTAIPTAQSSSGGPVLTIKERLMAGVYYILQEYGFWGIFLFASIPNPLFDLAGITCGHFLVPFSTFFGATFLGKSFVKSTIQSLLVITIFSKDTIERLLSLLAAYDENLYKVASKFVNKQIAALQRSHGTGSGSGSGSKTVEESSNIIGAAWNGVVAVMLLYFVMTIIESMAHSYLDGLIDDYKETMKQSKSVSSDMSSNGRLGRVPVSTLGARRVSLPAISSAALFNPPVASVRTYSNNTSGDSSASTPTVSGGSSMTSSVLLSPLDDNGDGSSHSLSGSLSINSISSGGESLVSRPGRTRAPRLTRKPSLAEIR